MRIEKVIKKYAKFNELSKKGQMKAIEKNRQINVDHEWFNFVFEDYTSKLKKLGFYDIKLYFTGFYSQGDGACFEAKHKKGNITHRGLYYHDNTIYCENDTVLALARRISKNLYKDLESNYEYLTSNEAIIETIEANDLEFDADFFEVKL